MPDLTCKLVGLIHRLQPTVILTHPYEGGHPDHDACSLAVRAALDSSPEADTELWEFTSYHAGAAGVETFTSSCAPVDSAPFCVGFFGPARETARSAHHKIIGHDAWAGLCDAPGRGRQRHCGSVLRPGHVSGRNRLVALRRQRHCTSRATSRLRVQARRAKIYPLFMLEFGEHNGMRGTELCLTSDPRRRHQDRTGEENSQGRNIDVSFS